MAVVSSLQFLKEGDPQPFPDITDPIEADRIDIFVLDNGMRSGRPSVALTADLPDGRKFVIQTSARLFCTHARAIMARYPDLFDGD